MPIATDLLTTERKVQDSTQRSAINAFNHVHLNNPGAGSYTEPGESITCGFGTITGDVSRFRPHLAVRREALLLAQ